MPPVRSTCTNSCAANWIPPTSNSSRLCNTSALRAPRRKLGIHPHCLCSAAQRLALIIPTRWLPIGRLTRRNTAIFCPGVFDEWRRKDLGRVLVNYFETLVAQHLGLPSQICIYSEFCGKGVVVEHDGSTHSCDHYVYPEYRLGTLRDKPLAEMVFSPTQVKFGYAKSEALPRYCRACPYLSDCWGECLKNRLLRTPDGEPGLNYLCAGLKKFYKHALPETERIAAGVRQQQQKSSGANLRGV